MGVPEDRRAVVEVVLRGGEPFLRAAAGRSVEVDTRDASSPHTAVLLVPLADFSNGTQDIGWSFDVDTEAGTLAVRVFGSGGELLGTATTGACAANCGEYLAW